MRKKILIVEDEQAIVEILSARLIANGYDVLAATDGSSGLEMAKTTNPDLILLDVMLPHVNGFSVCSLLKGNDHYKNIPVIMVTARSEDNDRIFADDVKPDAFINKPFQTQDLLEKIRELTGAVA